MSALTRTLTVAIATATLAFAGVCSAFAAGMPVAPAGVDPAAFQPSASCSCHSTLVEQWRPSMHAAALTDPVYVTKVTEADKATGGKLVTFCKKCHGPGATMTGEIASGAQLSAGTAEGVNCSFCHQVVGLQSGAIGNTSHVVDPSGTRRAQIKDPRAPHPAQFSELHTKADFCGGCHNVMHPVNGMHLESTYKEWSESAYAKEGVVCQNCHMATGPNAKAPTTGVAAGGAPERTDHFGMTFSGANVGQGQADIATALLKSAAEIKLEVPEFVAEGETTTATVTITNVGAGHKLPTGLTEVRQMWLEVSAVDESGETTAFGTHVFGTILQDDKGNAPVELWEATKIKSDDRIGPRETVTYAYEFKMPAGVSANNVKAALFYKSTPDALATKAGVSNPVTEMATAEQAVYTNPAARDAAAAATATSEPRPGSAMPLGVWLAIGAVAVAVVAAVIVWRRTSGPGA